MIPGEARVALPAPALRVGPLVEPATVRDLKDPCPVFDGERWHVFGSGGSVVTEEWGIAHATAPVPAGPWSEEPGVVLQGLRSPRVAAPGVVHDGSSFHMFVQTDFLSVGGTVEHLVSEDGQRFRARGTALASQPATAEAGLFDAHPALVAGRRLLTYAAMGSDLHDLRWNWQDPSTRARGPDVFLADSDSDGWDGPWSRRRRILTQEEVPFHVQQGHEDYEWGLEGPQLLALAEDRVLLTAVCFVAGRRGTRQRVFLADAPSPLGPYRVIGPVLEPCGRGWESGEVGHATTVVVGDALWVFYQARPATPGPHDDGEARWRFGVASWPVAALRDALATRASTGAP